MRIKSITIEGMHNVLEKKYTFGNFNYLYGKNGAGKSTVLQAVQLALLGYIPGVDKKNDALFQHARSKALSVTCVLDDAGKEITITRSLVGTGKSVTKQVSITPEGIKLEDILSDIELPIYNFSEFLRMSSNQMKDWFINFLPPASSHVDWQKQLTEALGEIKLIDPQLVSVVLSHIKNTKGNELEVVRATNTFFKEYLSSAKADLQRVQSTIQSLIHYDECEACDVESIQENIRTLQDQMMKATLAASQKERNRKIREQLDVIHVNSDSLEDDEEYKQLADSNKTLNDALIKFRNDLSELTEKMNNIKVDIRSKEGITSGGGICPYTKSACESIATMIAKLTKEIAKLNKQGSELASTYSNTKLAYESAVKSISATSTKMKSIEQKYANRKMLCAQIQEDEIIEGGDVSVTDMKQEITQLQDTLVKAAANQKYNELIDRITAQKYQIENSIEAMKLWIKLTDVNGLQSTLMVEPFHEMESDMDAYLQKMFNRTDISSHFNLSNKSNSFNFGLMRDDKYITFEMLSSGEKCMYTLAIMMCIIARSTSPLKLILIDDLLDHLDDENAATLFESLDKVTNIQIILAGVKECKVSINKDVIIEVK